MSNESEPHWNHPTPLPKQPLGESIRDMVIIFGIPAGMVFMVTGIITANPHSTIAATIMTASAIGGAVYSNRT